MKSSQKIKTFYEKVDDLYASFKSLNELVKKDIQDPRDQKYLRVLLHDFITYATISVNPSFEIRQQLDKIRIQQDKD